MGDFIELGTHRSTNIRVKIESLQNSSYRIESKDLYMRFLTAQLYRTLIKNILDMKGTQKCTKYQQI